MTRGRAGLGRRSLVLGAGVGLAGCGFRPIYAPIVDKTVGTQDSLGTVRVGVIPERSGQLLHQALQRRLDHGDALAKRYDLVIGFSITSDAIGVQQDTTVNRLRMVGSANWLLKAIDPPQATVTSGLARSLDGVNILDQQYFEADLAGETATRRIAEALADQITLQLATYFARTPKPA